MKLRTRLLTVAALATATLASAAGVAATATAATRAPIRCEVDNGTSWTLANCPAASTVSSSGVNVGYADAGIVVDLGPAASFNGVQVSADRGVSQNIWIADGPEATTPGTHLLSAGVDFDYGLGQADGTWLMTGKPDGFNGQSLTAKQVRTDFAGYEIYAWVGLANSGTTDTKYISAVNGQFANRLTEITAKSGQVTASVGPLFGL